MRKRLLLTLCASLTVIGMAHARPTVLSEDFIDVTTLDGAGWIQQNNSTNPGDPWGQGDPSIFDSQSGFPNEYIAAGFTSTTGDSGGGETISNWLLTPEITLDNNTTLTFYSRTVDSVTAPDAMEVRLSTSGSSTNVGGTPDSVGDFATVLLTINPSLALDGYPAEWTQFTATVSGLSAPTTGRIGFRYFITDGGPAADNGNYIGVDTVRVASAVTVPEAGTVALGLVPALCLMGCIWNRRIRSRSTMV